MPTSTNFTCDLRRVVPLHNPLESTGPRAQFPRVAAKRSVVCRTQTSRQEWSAAPTRWPTSAYADLAGQRLLESPPMPQPAVERNVRHAGTSRPLYESQGDASVGHAYVRPSIVCLFAYRCPSAVARRVVAVIVSPLNLVFRARAPAHVLQEDLEPTPTTAYANTSRAVVFVLLTARIAASRTQ